VTATPNQANGGTARPRAPIVNPDGIPLALRSLPLWCTWSWKLVHDREGQAKWTKPPVRDASNRITRGPFNATAGEAQIGFVHTGGLRIDGVPCYAFDLDACRDPITGKVEPWAMDVVHRCGNSFTEVSPSGCGLRVWVRVKNPPAHWKKKSRPITPGEPPAAAGGKQPECEVFGGGLSTGGEEYTTVTGQRLDGTSENIEVIEDVNWWPSIFGHGAEGAALATGEMPTGIGEQPSREDIRAAFLASHPRAAALLAKDLDTWNDSPGPHDVSRAAHSYAQRLLIASNGHAEAALSVIRGSVWDAGDYEGLAGSQRYDTGWWRAELARAWLKGDLVRKWRQRVGLEPVFKDETHADDAAPAAHEHTEDAPPASVVPAAPAVLVDFASRFAELRSNADDGVLVPGLLARGRITNLGAGPKTGKSTFLQAALVGFAMREPRALPGFGAPARPLRVLCLSENNANDDAIALTAFAGPVVDFGDGALRLVDRRCIPVEARSTWRSFLRWVADLMKKESFDVAVIDSFEAWIPDLDDANASAQIAQRYADLSEIIAQGCNAAVVCVLHTKKAAGPTLDFDAMLGSTKFRASSDFNLLMVRVAPDDPSDTRIVLRREGRDPWGLVKRVCGRLPAGVPDRVRDRDHTGTTRLCFRLVGEIVVGPDGIEAPAMRYEPVPVPPEWAAAASTGRQVKMSKPAARDLDERVLLAAVSLHANEHGKRPVSTRALVKDGFLERALVRLGDAVPASYTAPGDRKVRSIEARLVEDGRLVAHNGGGVTAGTPVFEPVGGAE
jgi:hypothetical protein